MYYDHSNLSSDAGSRLTTKKLPQKFMRVYVHVVVQFLFSLV